uniref:Copiatype polyprotein putative n=1 Tax=Albugo laibachii Nc14 TaxID=890382 RepID=F0WG21_9STRA|nr:copiatype polyprotein putative [Albugo laibachii Nc14]|eukprot:CCA20155.1 copiatype polyprotein putative [Albugo laibachii Nc14]
MSALEMRDLGVVKKFLGLRISLDEEVEYVLDQEMSFDLLLKKYGLETTNGVRAPIVQECNDYNYQEPEALTVMAVNGNESVNEFQSLVGWTTRYSAVGLVVKYLVAIEMPRVRFPDGALYFTKFPCCLSPLTNAQAYNGRLEEGVGGASSGDVKIESCRGADFAADKSDRKSVWGCVVMIGGAVVSWSCKNQTVLSQSTIKADLIAASQAGRELLGLNDLFQELGLKIAEQMKMKM